MTKKSAGRIERDAKQKAAGMVVKGDEAGLMKWDDLEGIYEQNSEMLVVANTNMVNVFKIPGMIAGVPDKKGTVDHIRGLSKDIKFFGEELIKIRRDHKEKTGVIDNSEDTITAIKIYEGYVNWQQEYHSVIIPTITFLSEQAGLAAEAIEKASDLLDPSVITDVQSKDQQSDSNLLPAPTNGQENPPTVS